MASDVPLSKDKLTIIMISVVFWGLSFPAIKVALGEVEPITLGFLRAMLGAIPISVFAIKKIGIKDLFYSLKQHPLPFIMIAMFQYFLPLVFQNVGMTMMDPKSAASTSSILQATSPVFTIFLSALFLGEHIGMKKGVGTGIAMSGAFLLVTRGGVVLSGTNLIGNILLLGSAIVYSFASVTVKKTLTHQGPLKISAISLILSTIFFLPTSIMLEPIGKIQSISGETWLLILFLGLICNGIAMIFWYNVLSTRQLSKQILFVYLIPLFGTLFSNLFVGEEITLKTVIFGIVIILGITIAQYSRKNSKKSD